MLYTSTCRGSCSAIKFRDYCASVNYTIKDIKLKPCTHHSHPFLAPFFMANGLVIELVDTWLHNNPMSPLIDSVRKILTMYMCDEDNSEAYMYPEEDWTDRLVNTLALHPFFADEASACLKSFKFGDNSLLDRFREQRFGLKRTVTVNYLFHGLPDIYLINKHAQIIQCASGEDALLQLVPEEGGSSMAQGQPNIEADTPPTACATHKLQHCRSSPSSHW